MSGSHFVETLRRLGYPGAEQLQGASFDWLFEKDALVPFLDWFCEEVQPANLLETKELEEFAQLEKSPEGILEVAQLQNTLRSLSEVDDDIELTDAELRDETQIAEEDLQHAQGKKDMFVQQRNKLSLHKASLEDRLAKLDSLENMAKSNYKQCLQQAQADNNKMNETLERLTGGVEELCRLYQDTAAGTQETWRPENVVFLSQLDLSNYHKTEEKFSQELTAFTKKQFFEGIADMAGERELSRFEFLEISNPDTLLVKGEKEDARLDDCKELARLQTTYPSMETQRVNALVEERATLAACDFMENKLQALRDVPYPTNIAELSGRLKESQSVLSVLQRDVAGLADDEVPTLIRDSAAQQVTKVLRGDYDLKIARQNYFIANQEQVIDHLVIQRSRSEFLTMAFEVEGRSHRETRKLLTAINMLLQKSHSARRRRMKVLEDPALSGARHQRSTIDSRDKSTLRLHQLLDRESFQEKPQLFVTYAQLTENAELMHDDITSQRASLSSANNSQDNRLATLERSLTLCESTVYAGSSTTGGLPRLSPQPILDTLTQLDAVLGRLEQAVLDIIKDVDTKKKVLRSDPLQVTERELFVYFFNDPDKLRRALADVSSQLQAQMVK